MTRSIVVVLLGSLLLLPGMLGLGNLSWADEELGANSAPEPAAPADEPAERLVPLDEVSQGCMDCHGDPDLEPETDKTKGKQLSFSPTVLMGSVHEDIGCVDCHQGADNEDNPHYEAGGVTTTLACGDCHDDAMEVYNVADVHGAEYRKGNENAPWCHDCHGSHDILPTAARESAMSALNQPETCGRCHGSEKLNVDDGGISKRRLLERYKESVHWGSIQEGKPAASCSDCHSHHNILPSSDVNSRVTREGLLRTCAKCHPAIVSVYSKGSHGRTLLHGNLDVPTCTTCHGDHDIISLKVTSGGRRDFAATQVCIWCHGNERMMSRYALDTSPVDSYMRDFHGLAQRGTAGTAATCADCHDAHHSLPSNHPESRMHLSNRGSACGKCHGQSSDNFILSFSHKTPSNIADQTGIKVNRIITIVYLVLIISVVGGMLLHNFIVWHHAIRRKKRWQRRNAAIVRMNKFDRVWHWTLLISFIILALTGFALEYSNSVFFRWMYDLGFTEAIRAWLHRVAAVVMTVDLLIFFGYQMVSRHGRRWFWEMLPTLRDVRDFIATVSYYLGRRKDRPRQTMFGYVEKAEYWALMWGTVVMLLTGLILWFPRQLPASWPSWVIEVSTTIHLLEAILASLAILVWHFFSTILHPAEYPMDTSWLTGVLTEEEAHHRFEDEAIDKQRPSPEHLDPDDEKPDAPAWVDEV